MTRSHNQSPKNNQQPNINNNNNILNGPGSIVNVFDIESQNGNTPTFPTLPY